MKILDFLISIFILPTNIVVNFINDILNLNEKNLEFFRKVIYFTITFSTLIGIGLIIHEIILLFLADICEIFYFYF